uniref:Uncharacterized protein n=1 Tax=Panagrolaimus sp. PS1159 TaxID=55785 RepID=A0AC35G1L7_9BILA
MAANLKPIFGQEYRHACGYDNEKFMLVSGSTTTNSRPSLVTRKLETSAAIMSDHDDFKNLVKALQITEMQLLDMQMQGVESIQNIIEFIENNVSGKTMILNIYVITHQAKVKSSKVQANNHKATKISNILLGHHVLVCIPLDDSVEEFNLDYVRDFASMPAGIVYHFQKEVPALINYKRVETQSVTKIMQESQNFSSDEIISLFAQIEASLFEEVQIPKAYIPVAAIGALLVAGASVIGYLVYKKYYQSNK